jgi:MIP family channel proteins
MNSNLPPTPSFVRRGSQKELSSVAGQGSRGKSSPVAEQSREEPSPIAGQRSQKDTTSFVVGPSQVLWRRCVAEFIGTFTIVFAPVAFLAAGKTFGGDGSLMGAAWVSGLAVLAMVYALGPISAAHFNPAVTLGFAVSGRFPWRCVAAYWTAEILGGVAAAGVAALLFGSGHGMHVPAAGVTLGRAVGLEAVLTFFLMLVIMAVATDKRVNGAVPGIAIGLTVVFDILIGGSVTGASMNPARSLGPALFAGGAALSSYWIYVVGPAIGAVVAALAYEAMRGGREHAQGAPADLMTVTT